MHGNFPSRWDIALDAWIIQDGNYPDFAVGQMAEFALEFWIPDTARCKVSDADKSVRGAGTYIYETVCDMVLLTTDIAVHDLGILVYRESNCIPDWLRPGNRIATTIGLGVDPFFYFERLSKIPGVPPMVYSWKIENILRQTAPFVEKIAEDGPLRGQKIMTRDQNRLGREAIPKTDAWNDDDGHGNYVLRCKLLPIEPKHNSATAT